MKTDIIHTFFFFFWLHCKAWGILVPWPETELTSPAAELSLNHWTAREVPYPHFKNQKIPAMYFTGLNREVVCTKVKAAPCLCALSCLTLCDPVDSSLAGSSIQGILQARILKQVVIPSSRGSSPPRDGTCVCVSPAWQAGSLPWSHQGSLMLH